MAIRHYARDVAKVSHILKREYRDFAHYNLRDPLYELIFILCSQKTAEQSYRAVFADFRKRFPRPTDLARASRAEFAEVLQAGGLSGRKAKALHGVVTALVDAFGEPTLEPLRGRPAEVVEEFLTTLPGVGPKVARCVMMYSLGFQVFPVDVHCWRISRRIGWVRPTRRDRRCAPNDMDRLQAKIPPDLRYSLHVNMISHGRRVCAARSPCCNACAISDYCKRVGVKS